MPRHTGKRPYTDRLTRKRKTRISPVSRGPLIAGKPSRVAYKTGPGPAMFEPRIHPRVSPGARQTFNGRTNSRRKQITTTPMRDMNKKYQKRPDVPREQRLSAGRRPPKIHQRAHGKWARRQKLINERQKGKEND